MVKRRMGAVALLICLCIALTPCVTKAASTSDAKEFIDTDKSCSLTLSYSVGGTPISDVSVRLYMIAEISSDFIYTPTSPFSSSNLILNGIQTVGEWNIIRTTVQSVIIADSISEISSAVTDSDGKVYFDNLKAGLYIAISDPTTVENNVCRFESALISLPNLDTDGLWLYDVSASPKPIVIPPTEEETELKILKLWNGDSKSDRPERVEIEIFRNGESYQTVFLTEENNWTYSWKSKIDGAEWKVVERHIPKGYSMTVEEKEDSFILTNTYISSHPEEPKPPETGDTSNVLFYIILLNLVGITLTVLGILGKRQKT